MSGPSGCLLKWPAPLGNSSTVEHQNSRLVLIKSRVGFTINAKSCHVKPKESAAIVKLCAVNFWRRKRHAEQKTLLHHIGVPNEKRNGNGREWLRTQCDFLEHRAIENTT